MGRRCFHMKRLSYLCVNAPGNLQQNGLLFHVNRNDINRHLKTSAFLFDKSGTAKDYEKSLNTTEKLTTTKNVSGIVVKTETDENNVVTKVTIEKPQATPKKEVAPQGMAITPFPLKAN